MGPIAPERLSSAAVPIAHGTHCRGPVRRTTTPYSTSSSRSLGAVKRQDDSAFILTYIFLLRSCSSIGAFIISPVPPILSKESCTAGPLGSTGVTPLHSYYGPIRHRLVFGRFPGLSGYTTYLAPPISRRDEDGFSSCLACPCHRAASTTPPEWAAASVRMRHPMLSSSDSRGLDLRGFYFFEATYEFTYVAAQ